MSALPPKADIGTWLVHPKTDRLARTQTPPQNCESVSQIWRGAQGAPRESVGENRYRCAEWLNGTASAATISLPIGHSAIPASFRCAQAKGMPDDSHREYDRGDEMAERQPPAGEHEPDDVAEEPERPGAEIMPGIFGARHRFPTERQQRVGGDIERRARPGNPDDGDRHDHGRDHPSDCHLQTAEHDPQQVQ